MIVPRAYSSCGITEGYQRRFVPHRTTATHGIFLSPHRCNTETAHWSLFASPGRQQLWARYNCHRHRPHSTLQPQATIHRRGGRGYGFCSYVQPSYYAKKKKKKTRVIANKLLPHHSGRPNQRIARRLPHTSFLGSRIAKKVTDCCGWVVLQKKADSSRFSQASSSKEAGNSCAYSQSKQK